MQTNDTVTQPENLRYKNVPTKVLEQKAEEASIKARVTPNPPDDGKPDTEDLQIQKAVDGTKKIDVQEAGPGA